MNEMQAMFLKNIKRLSSGEKAMLKRSAGKLLKDADGNALAVFYRCLPNNVPAYQEDRWFAVACLRCMWDAEVENGDPLEKIIKQMITSKSFSDSAIHRIEILLSTRWDNDGYMLTKLTRLLKLVRQKSNRSPIDFAALLNDLIYWNAENQSVQKKWARSIYTGA